MGPTTHTRFVDSPHFDARPPGTDVELIVLHAISLPPGEFGMLHVESLFTGRLDCGLHPFFAELERLRVSAHFVVDRTGRITQFVPVQDRAWHAGESIWHGRPRCNDFSVGIEMLGDETHVFTAAQYRETARLCRALTARFPAIPDAGIVGHSDVAPGRKWDPGAQWDWARFHRSLVRIRNIDVIFR